MERITLASASPRRLEILKKLNLSVIVKPPNITEIIDKTLSPEENAKLISLKKLNYIKKLHPDDPWILSADTFISYKNKILGKPKDIEDAKYMLKTLSGDSHQVMTGISIYSKKMGKTVTEVDITTVTFKKLNERDIEFYLNTNQWIDAAGAYKIQETGEILIESINGSYSSVMGLPISRIYGMFVSLNFYLSGNLITEKQRRD